MTNIQIRPVTLLDAQRILEIYQPYVLETTITFETELPSIEEIQERIMTTTLQYPYIIAEYEGEIVGYAYAGRFRKRQAYAQSAEISLYLDQNIRGKGFGKALLYALEMQLREQDVYTLISIVESSNIGSLKFHEKNGFIRAGYLPRIGHKFDKWLDIHLLTKQIKY